jgi:hypothetical protein
MEGGINQLKEYSLSDADIRKMLGNDIKILTYPMLGKMRNINEAFDSKGRCMLLFLTENETTGHWVCMINRPKEIEFFDSYGEAPEEQKDMLSASKLEQLDQKQPYLMKLLRGSGKKVIYNTHQFQQEKSGVNTCGRWCVARLLYAPKSLDYFYNVIKKSGMNPDTFVSGLTANALGK